MDREIKFKAWTGKELIYDLHLALENGVKISICSCIGYEFIPFIGLMDRNKKEIYIGDVVKYTKHEGYLLESFIAEIVWINSIACYGYNKIGLMENGFYDAIIHPFSEHDEFEIDVLPFIEIIGNKFENPELLQS
jgi:hypothetical protein